MLFIANNKIYKFDSISKSSNCSLCIASEILISCMEYSMTNYLTRCHEVVRHLIVNNSKDSELRKRLLDEINGIRSGHLPVQIKNYSNISLYKLAYLKHHN